MSTQTIKQERRPRRWSDRQKQLAPFTWSSGDFVSLGIMLDTGAEEDLGLHLRLHCLKCTLIIELPQFINPQRKKIAANWDQATIQRLGRDWYYQEHPREYGFSLTAGFLQVHFGAQTGDSATTQDWCCQLPWQEWRFVRYSLYGLQGEHFWTEPAPRRPNTADDAFTSIRERCDQEERVPKLEFLIEDYDGKKITVTTFIEEHEWHFGSGWFKWLSWIRPAKIRRSLSLKFSEELGPEKGSWKGGIVGTGANMLPGELHEAAFRRWCEEEHRSKHRRFKVRKLGVFDGGIIKIGADK